MHTEGIPARHYPTGKHGLRRVAGGSTAYATLTLVKAMLSSVEAFALLRLSEKATPTIEKSRSTAADDAGQPRTTSMRMRSCLW